jgi:mannose/fructose-specific phosphotransferase system component IIA
MIGVVVVTHGHLATELLNAAETIVGDLPRFTAVSIGWHEDVQDARDEIGAAIGRVQAEHGVLLLTDMFTDLLGIARELREHGRNAIWVASDLLRGEKVER